MAKYKVPTTKELLDAGVHFGHQTRRWHPAMEKYIFAVKKKIHIFDLEQTEELLKEACEYLFKVASEGGQIVFVGTKKQAREIVRIEAKRCGAFYVSERWLGGTITNFSIIKKNMDKLVDYMRKREEGEFNHYTKKERLLIDREIERLEKSVGGLVGLNAKPVAIFAIDARREKTAVREANIADVKVIALVDTNTDPQDIDYVIPGNDDAIKSIALVIKAVADSVEAGYKEYAKKTKAGVKDEKEVVKEKVKKVKKVIKKEAKSDTKKTTKTVAKPEAEKEATKVSGDESPVSSEKAGKKAVEKYEEVIEKVEDDLEEDVTDEAKEVKSDDSIKEGKESK